MHGGRRGSPEDDGTGDAPAFDGGIAMKTTALTIAAVLTLCAGGLAWADDAGKAAPDASAPAAAPDAGAPASDTSAPAAPAAAPAAPAADQAAPAPDQTAPSPAMTEQQMLREVRQGALAATRCSKADNVTVDSFNQCVTDTLADAGSKGTSSESYQLGAQYRSYAFMVEKADSIRDRGEEWSKQYRTANKMRDSYWKTVQDLVTRTGLDGKKVCNAIDVTCAN